MCIRDSSDIETLNKRISNKNFVDKAPKNIVDECFAKLKEGNLQSERINKKLKLLKWYDSYFWKYL